MTVITKLRRQWFHKQGRFPPEDVEAVLKMRHTFGQRDGETEADWRTRLQRQDEEAMARADREEEEADRMIAKNERD